MCWGHDPSLCCGKRIRECLFSQYKQEELPGTYRLRIYLAVRPKSVGVCFNAFSQGWTDPVHETLCFKFYVKHEKMDGVKEFADSKQ